MVRQEENKALNRTLVTLHSILMRIHAFNIPRISKPTEAVIDTSRIYTFLPGTCSWTWWKSFPQSTKAS